MGGYFGAVSRRKVTFDVFYGVDYHSHLGTKSAGITMWDNEKGFHREIHSISNTPFRTKFEKELDEMQGTSGIGCINDAEAQPIIVRSHLGIYSIIVTGLVTNIDELAKNYLATHNSQLTTQSNGKVYTTELIAGIINEGESIEAGIADVQNQIEGSLTIMILKSDGHIVAARDKLGRLPVWLGKDADGYCVTFESFAGEKMGYERLRELGPGEIVEVSDSEVKVLREPGKDMKVCVFLWSYYGYPNATYEGVNVEVMRYRNGEIMARDEEEQQRMPEVDYVAGVPDSGIAHAMGYASESGIPYARPLVKYTPTWPRSFIPENQSIRNQVARMKQIPVYELIKGNRLLFIDDSIVRGTQIKETVDFLYEAGVEEVHMRSACPPIMYACKYLNFSRSNSDKELFVRKLIADMEGQEGDKHLEEYADFKTERGKCLLQRISEELGIQSFGFQSLEGLIDAIGIDKNKICTYCWTGKE